MVGDELELPKIKKKLRLDEIDELKLPDIQLGLDELTKFSRDLDQLAGISNMRKNFSLGESLRLLDESTISLSEILVNNGTITNAGAVKAVLSPGLLGTFVNFDFMSQIKAMDTIISFREMSTNLDFLKNSTIPHMSLFRGILNSIDESIYIRIKEEKEEIIEDEDDFIGEDFTIVRPECLSVALNINMYVTVTENHIQSSDFVNEDEKRIWEKYVKPLLIFIMGLFVSWSMGNTPIADMQIVKQFDRVVEIIDNYHYPIETTNIDVNDEP